MGSNVFDYILIIFKNLLQKHKINVQETFPTCMWLLYVNKKCWCKPSLADVRANTNTVENLFSFEKVRSLIS